MPVRGATPSGLVLVGTSLTEATTTSTSEVDLLTISSLNIPATTPIQAMWNYRKTAGGAYSASTGLRLNTITLLLPVVTGATAIADAGFAEVVVNAREALYPYCGLMRYGATDLAAAHAFLSNAPSVTVTSIVVRGYVANAAITLGVDQLRAFTFAG